MKKKLLNLLTTIYSRFDSKGFTLSELLIVVGIITALVGVGTPAVIHYQKTLHQKELDEKAQIIYIAAQNQLSVLENEGKRDLYSVDEDGTPYNPDAAIHRDGDKYYVVWSDVYSGKTDGKPTYLGDSEKTLAYNLMFSTSVDGSVDDELFNHDWAIEYNPYTATVDAVFYSDDDETGLNGYSPSAGDFATTLRGSANDRIAAGNKIGYYGGEMTEADAKKSDKLVLVPSVELVNEEVLYAKIKCYAGYENKEDASGELDDIVFNVEITDEFYDPKSDDGDHIFKMRVPLKTASGNSGIKKEADGTYTYILVLDDLSNENSRFNALFKDILAPGSDITVTATVSAKTKKKAISRSASATTNSLFADMDHYTQVLDEVEYEANLDEDRMDERTAVIQYGRHLQNLDEASGVNSSDIKYVKAIQVNDIDFLSELPEGEDSKESTKYFYTTYSRADHNNSEIFKEGYIDLYDENGLLVQKIKGDGSGTHSYFNGSVSLRALVEAKENVPNIRPISNGALREYRGAYVANDPDSKKTSEKYNSYHSISNLIVTNKPKTGSYSAGVSFGKNLGLFDLNNSGAVAKVEGLDFVDSAILADGNDTNVGILSGSVGSSSLSVDHVRVYLSKDMRNLHNNTDIWISGTNAGGLIGVVTGGTLNIKDSFVASVVGDVTTANRAVDSTATAGPVIGELVKVNAEGLETKSAGGLIGKASAGTINITHSYADNYITGQVVGGLVGLSEASCTLKETYVAGYSDGFRTKNTGAIPVNPTKYMAGLVAGKANITDSYTVLTYLKNDTAPGVVYDYYTYSTAKEGITNNVVYLISSTDSTKNFAGTTSIEVAKNAAETAGKAATFGKYLCDEYFATAFTSDTTETEAYNLMGQNLDSYPYPRLKDPADFAKMDTGYGFDSAIPATPTENMKSYLSHYNDWEDEFKNGSLVYYERYGITQTQLKEYYAKNENISMNLTEDAVKNYVSAATYTDGMSQFGFFGANISALKEDQVIIGDGYGIVYRKNPSYYKEVPDETYPDDIPDKLNIEIKIKVADPADPTGEKTVEKVLKQTIALKDNTAANYVRPYAITNTYSMNGKDETGTFYIYPLDVKIVNTDYASKDYYQLVSITALDSVSGGTDAVASSERYYYYNPHMAKSVIPVLDATVTTPKIATGNIISIRDARHLYNLSRYYNTYADVTKNAYFTQEQEIDYILYDWTGSMTSAVEPGKTKSPENYFVDATGNKLTDRIREQSPIGAGTGTKSILGGQTALPFTALYNGMYHEIRHVSFKSVNGQYSGLFGVNNGTLMNIFVPADYTEGSSSNQYTAIGLNIGSNVTAHLGVLAGLNDSKGFIYNCAVAGYAFNGPDSTISSYNGSEVYAGGLAGRNVGRIINSSADIPVINLNVNYSKTEVGGFVGSNSGFINNSYALAAIDVKSCKGEKSNIGGFTATNTGSISGSYCATALISSGDEMNSHGFTTAGSNVSGCEYLDAGSFTFVGKQYAYSADHDLTSGKPIAYVDLVKEAASAPVTAERSFYHKNTVSKTMAYPYRGVVTNKDGAVVHYGEWQDDIVMGSVGVFYWEKEVGGRNNGYHFTFLGTSEETEGDKKDANKDGSETITVTDKNGKTVKLKYLKGTSLCNAHDDGGVIEEYGYGFYVMKGFGKDTRVVTDGIELSGTNVGEDSVKGEYIFYEGDDSGEFVINTDARIGLQSQLEGYDIYPYTTRMPGEVKDSDNDKSYIYLSAQGDTEKCEPNGTIKIIFTGSDVDTKVAYTYTVSPFFANAFSFNSYQKNDEAPVYPDAGEKIEITSKDYTVTDYIKKPGLEEKTQDSDGNTITTCRNKYEIRSAKQLQYINWNWGTRDCSELTVESNYKKFTYLTQASVLGMGSQTEASAKNNNRKYFSQTHDLNAEDIRNFTPIAAMGSTSTGITTGSYDTTLYAWFGGNYDGNSYKIKNINISSKAYSVGLFGTAVAANISNVILYSDNNSVIERKTTGVGDHNGAYGLGGLIGVAYDYAGTSSEAHIINNCSIAGYTVADNTKSQQSAGEANIGGLIGIANTGVHKCSAVVSTQINCTHGGTTGPYGNYIRVGGLVGANKGLVMDSYTGGSITVSKDLIKEALYPNRTPITDIKADVKTGQWENTHIYVGGISGSAFASTFRNFDNRTDSSEGAPRFRNCYTYITLPDVEGSIRSVSVIGGLADRFGKSGAPVPEFTNCYYWEKTADVSIDMPGYYFQDGKKITNAIVEASKKDMLMGNLNYMVDYYWNNGGKKTYTYNGMTALTYTQMAGRIASLSDGDAIEVIRNPLTGEKTGERFTSFATALNNGTGQNRDVWSYVTITEGEDVAINGKYSFPGANAALIGKNYPFATVIKQKDVVYSTKDSAKYVNVHYGEWPTDGMYWEQGRTTMDLFEDMNLTADKSDPRYGYAVKKFVLKDSKKQISGSVNKDEFRLSNGLADILSVNYNASDNTCTIEVRAKGTGSVEISYKDISFNLNITAKMPITVPESVTYDVAKASETTPWSAFAVMDLKATFNGTDMSSHSNLSWRIATNDADEAGEVYIDITQPDSLADPANPGKAKMLPKKIGKDYTLVVRGDFKYPAITDGSVETTTYSSEPKYVKLTTEKSLVKVDELKFKLYCDGFNKYTTGGIISPEPALGDTSAVINKLYGNQNITKITIVEKATGKEYSTTDAEMSDFAEKTGHVTYELKDADTVIYEVEIKGGESADGAGDGLHEDGPLNPSEDTPTNKLFKYADVVVTNDNGNDYTIRFTIKSGSKTYTVEADSQ